MPEHPFLPLRALSPAVVLFLAAGADAQLRVATWNVTNYSGGRVNEFQTSVYDSFMGRSLSPDLMIGQEFLSQAGVDAFTALLNTAPGSPGDWASAPFVNGPDTDNAMFYRTSRVQFLGHTVVATGGAAPNHPRNVDRYDVRPVGYDADQTTIAIYSSHMKAGSTSDDQSRRLLEAQRIRDDAESLPAAWSFMLGGDFNIQSSGQAAYVELVGAQANNDGRFYDPIATPGSWNNNGAFRFVHTQDPSGAGGMDDRHDQLLLSDALVDGTGLDYIGNPAIPYSTTTWDDPNHSYRSWGNDGTSYNVSLTVAGNTMVGSAIAQALVTSASGGGHLPVVLDLRLPPEIGSDTIIDFGSVPQGDVAEATLTVSHDGDVGLWGVGGLEDLEYQLVASPGFTTPGGPFVIAPAGPDGMHVITMDTSAVGPLAGTLTILSNSPDEPTRFVSLVGEVTGGCAADIDGDGDADGIDVGLFLQAYATGDLGVADLDGDGDLDGIDVGLFLQAYGQAQGGGCF